MPEALEVFADQPFKTEIIEGVDEGEGCRGHRGQRLSQPRVSSTCAVVRMCRSTGTLKAVQADAHRGAYWRGDEHNAAAAADLRDCLGITPRRWRPTCTGSKRPSGAITASSGTNSICSPFRPSWAAAWPCGTRRAVCCATSIEDYSRRTHLAHGYEIVASPHVAKADLWQTSGTSTSTPRACIPGWCSMRAAEYRMKPMNCPFHILIFESRGRSYRELPLRLFELGTVYRYERSGVVHGLLRARGFTQDDSHIFVDGVANRRRAAEPPRLHADGAARLRLR